jgi:hypothetical protein
MVFYLRNSDFGNCDIQEAQLRSHGWTEVLLEGENSDTVVMYGLGTMGALLAISTWLSRYHCMLSDVCC